MHEFIYGHKSQELKDISKVILEHYKTSDEYGHKTSDNLRGSVKENHIFDEKFVARLDKELKPLIEREINNFLAKNHLISSDNFILNNYSIMHHSEFYNIPLHYDAEYTYAETGEENVRNFAVLIYLNEDFEGGELIFPIQKETIKPEEGLLLIFPTSFMFPHVTSPAIGNDRYVLRVNYLFDKSEIKGTVNKSVQY